MKFGTDGIRGRYPDRLGEDTARELAAALCARQPGCMAVVGRDTRPSGEALSEAFCDALAAHGGIAVDVGVMPTAGVAYMTSRYGADRGVVVSASHNPAEYNGLKVFGKGGLKASEDDERALEEARPTAPIGGGRVLRAPYAAESYAAFVAEERDLCGMKVLLDCAHGAAGAVAKAAFEEAGARVTAINADGDGAHINDRCGALHARLLAGRAARFDAVFAFDGDADRVIALRPDGVLVDGDHILAMLADFMHKSGRLMHDTVVGTVMTNTGVERCLGERGISLVRTAVGDKYVLDEMLREGYNLGGEQAGHVIMTDILPTGDGIATALALCNVMQKSGKGLAELDLARDFPQCLINVSADARALSGAHFRAFERDVRANYPDCRIVIRPSGTEPLVRILAECEDATRAAEAADALAAALKGSAQNQSFSR